MAMWSIQAFIATVVIIIVTAILFSSLRWRRFIQARVEEVKETAGQLVMTRQPKRCDPSHGDDEITSSTKSKRKSRMAAQLDLSPAYRQYLREKYPSISIMSLGEYLDSLEPGAATNLLPEQEIDLIISMALIRVLGPLLGGALLPAVSMFGSNSKAVGISWLSTIAAPAFQGRDSARNSIRNSSNKNDNSNVETSTIGKQPNDTSSTNTLPITGAVGTSLPAHAVSLMTGASLFSIVGAAQLAISLSHRTIEASEESSGQKESPLQQFLKHGEVANPSFVQIPNPFKLAEHWHSTIEAMERKIRATSQPNYDPMDYPSTTPSPVNELLLPDLYVGVGDAKRTHTSRQIVRNRLFAILLNRLGTNYIRDEISDWVDEEFQIVINTTIDHANPDHSLGTGTQCERLIRYPSEFIQALQECQHSIHTRSVSRVTTFGFALCVKENGVAVELDTSKATETGESERNPDHPSERVTRWSHIPLAIPLQSGIDTPGGIPIPGYLTHSCTDYQISGPLLDDISVESYHNQDGYAGWISSHYNNLPWMYDCRARDLLDPVYTTEVSSVLFAAIHSVALRRNLPNGGYGTIGVCNDSAALVEYTVSGSTDIYPLVSIGKYYLPVIDRINELQSMMERSYPSYPSLAVQAAKQLGEAMMIIPNDIHPLPRTMSETMRRMRASLPEHPYLKEMNQADELLAIASNHG